MRMYLLSNVLCIGTVFCAVPLSAQVGSCTQRTVPVSVVTAGGLQTRDLQLSNFKAGIGKSPLRLLSLTPNNRPGRIVIVLDTSGSVVGSPYWSVYISVAESLLNNLAEGTQIGLIAFGSGTRSAMPLGEDRQKILDELISLAADSKLLLKKEMRTALWDSVVKASQMLEPPAEGDVIYVITDAGENASKIREKDVRQILISKGIRIFTFRVGLPEGDLTQSDLNGIEIMKELVADTGGVEAVVSGRAIDRKWLWLDKSGKPTKINRALAMQYESIPVHYNLLLELPGYLQTMTTWTLELVGLKTRDVILTYPRSLPACVGTPASADLKQ